LTPRHRDELRQETVDTQGWSDFEDEPRTLLDGVSASNLVRRNRIGTTALAAYVITRPLVRQKQHANLLPHVAGFKNSVCLQSSSNDIS
jgi:hypothetical protein